MATDAAPFRLGATVIERFSSEATNTAFTDLELALRLPRPSRLAGAVMAAAMLAPAPSAVAQGYQIVSPIQDVERLAEIIGGAHQIRQMCYDNDQQWREQMLALIELEAGDDQRRQRRLIDAFNAGFRDREREHRRCNAAARRDEAELAAEGRRLAEDLRDRYLN